MNSKPLFILEKPKSRTLICLAVSVMKMAELGFDDDILPPAPCRAVRNLECMSAGFGDGYRMRWVLSRRRRKSFRVLEYIQLWVGICCEPTWVLVDAHGDQALPAGNVL